MCVCVCVPQHVCVCVCHNMCVCLPVDPIGLFWQAKSGMTQLCYQDHGHGHKGGLLVVLQ
jgi:hypothetical protein